MTNIRQRAAIYTSSASYDSQKTDVMQKTLLDSCRRYCQQQGYHLAEEHIYQGHGEPFFGNGPQLVQLRLLVVQGQFDVLVVPSPECIGSLPLWRSLPTAGFIDVFYKHQVCIESVIKRHGTHDIYQQMLLDAMHVLKQM